MIFCVEDDENIRDLIVYTLENTGFKAQGFEDGKCFKAALGHEKPDLVLMDVMLPGEDGVSLLKDLRANSETEAIPVIMVTAKGAEFDKVKALDLGADDYVTKPFGMMELVSRIKAVLRRSGAGNDAGDEEILALGEIAMDTRRHQLREDVWGYDFDGETRTVAVHIRTLRQKLGQAGDKIETVRGVGYRIRT